MKDEGTPAGKRPIGERRDGDGLVSRDQRLFPRVGRVRTGIRVEMTGWSGSDDGCTRQSTLRRRRGGTLSSVSYRGKNFFFFFFKSRQKGSGGLGNWRTDGTRRNKGWRGNERSGRTEGRGEMTWWTS